MNRTVLSIIGLLGFVMLDWSCFPNNGGCGGGDYKDRSYTIKGVDTTVILSLKEMVNASWDMYKSGDTVAVDKFRIHVKLLRELISYNPKNHNFGTSTFAAPCPSPIDINDWELDSLHVVQIVNGRETELDSIVMSTNYYHEELALDWSEPTNRIMLNNLLDSDEYFTFSISILKAPNEVQVQSYRISFYLTDGRIFETTTAPILVKP